MAANPWPLGTASNKVQQEGPLVSNGTIINGSLLEQRGDVRSNYKRVGEWGLVTGNADGTYVIKPLFVRQQVFPSTTYLPLYRANGSPATDCVPNTTFNVLQGSIVPVSSSFLSNFGTLKTSSGVQVRSVDAPYLRCRWAGGTFPSQHRWMIAASQVVEPWSATRYHRVNNVWLAYPGYYAIKNDVAKNTYIAGLGTATNNDEPTDPTGPTLPATNIFRDAIGLRLVDTLWNQMSATLKGDPSWVAALDRHGPTAYTDLRPLIKKILIGKGYTLAQVNSFLAGPPIPSSSPTSDTGDNTGGLGEIAARPTPEIAPTPAVTKVVIRAPFGYAKPPAKAPDGRPQIVQNYVDYVKSGSKTRAKSGQEVFYFSHTPNNISYSGLGSEWSSIERAGNYPLVEWSNYKLMKVEFDIVLAEDRPVSGGTIVPDGIFVSVQDRLNTLRRMAQRQAPVSVYNLDDLFRVQVRRAAKTGKPMEFVIADMSVTSLRRSMESVEKEITTATVKLTLQEVVIEKTTIVKMSPPALTGASVPVRSSSTQPNSDTNPPDSLLHKHYYTKTGSLANGGQGLSLKPAPGTVVVY